MQRLTFILIPGVVASLLFFAVDAVQEGGLRQTTGEQVALEMDFRAYAENVNTVFFGENGRIDYTLSGTRQYQRLDGQTAIEQPLFRLYEAGEPDWNVVADSGTIMEVETGSTTGAEQSSNVDLTLLGNVEIFSIDEAGRRSTLRTEQLLIHTKDKTAETELPVSMTAAYMEQSATGMFAELQRDTIRFYRDARGQYVPPTDEQNPQEIQ